MSLDLIDESSTYELQHDSGAVFVMKHWTVGMQEEIERRCISIDVDKGRVTGYDSSLERELKIKMALHSWREVRLGGVDAVCTDENKKRLPVGVIMWLSRQIDERSGVRISEAEKKS